MSEIQLSFAAAVFELGIPIFLLFLLWKYPAKRAFASLLLGTLSPFLFLYLLCSIAYFLDSDSSENQFGFFAMWIMSFALYVVFLIFGVIAAAFLKVPQSPVRRFFAGLSPALILILCFALKKVIALQR